MLKQLFGILLVFLSWLNPFGFQPDIQVLLYIIGFDLMGLFIKICVYILEFIFDISGLGWYLIILIGVEAIIHLLELSKFFDIVLKPAAVFLIIYLNNLGWELALIIAGIDLMLNFSKNYFN